MQSPIYGRFNQYSAQKTGFEHLAPNTAGEVMDAAALQNLPTNLTDHEYFLLKNPFGQDASKFHLP
jgi:hypothetical protein